LALRRSRATADRAPAWTTDTGSLLGARFRTFRSRWRRPRRLGARRRTSATALRVVLVAERDRTPGCGKCRARNRQSARLARRGPHAAPPPSTAARLARTPRWRRRRAACAARRPERLARTAGTRPLPRGARPV